ECGPYKFSGFETSLNFDLGLSNQIAQVRNFSGALKQAGLNGGSFDMSGAYDPSNQTGRLAFKLADLNQNVLRSVLASALGDKKLDSVSITINTTVNYAAKGESTIKTEL